MPHDPQPELAAKLRKCFFDFQFSGALKKEYPDDDRMLPMSYKETWRPIREVAERSGTPYNKPAYEAQMKREAEAAAKKAAEAEKAPAKP
jgi:phosphonate transport system substrate-binding protein